MKKLTLVQEEPVIFVRERSDLAYKAASDFTKELAEKGCARNYAVAYAVILTPIIVGSETVVSKTKR